MGEVGGKKYFILLNKFMFSAVAMRGEIIRQGSSTHGPRAACGPRASFVRPRKGISQNTMRYEY